MMVEPTSWLVSHFTDDYGCTLTIPSGKNQINLRYLLEYLDIKSKLNHSLGLYFPNTGHFGFILKGYSPDLIN